MTSSLENKRAIITAGASGIGLAIAKQLLVDGADVFVCDIDSGALASLPDGIHGSRVDVSSSDAMASWIAPIAESGIDILVNNAGIAGPTQTLEDTTVDDWKHCLSVSLDSHFYATRAVVPGMKKAGEGCIVNISSTAGLLGFPLRTAYSAAKFAIIGLTKTWAMELGSSNIRVNAIAPGAVGGDRLDRVISAHAKAEGVSEDKIRKLYALGTSMNAFISPEEIAHMVAYLCSTPARRISGQVISVDGHTETNYAKSMD